MILTNKLIYIKILKTIYKLKYDSFLRRNATQTPPNKLIR